MGAQLDRNICTVTMNTIVEPNFSLGTRYSTKIKAKFMSPPRLPTEMNRLISANAEPTELSLYTRLNTMQSIVKNRPHDLSFRKWSKYPDSKEAVASDTPSTIPFVSLGPGSLAIRSSMIQHAMPVAAIIT